MLDGRLEFSELVPLQKLFEFRHLLEIKTPNKIPTTNAEIAVTMFAAANVSSVYRATLGVDLGKDSDNPKIEGYLKTFADITFLFDEKNFRK